MRLKIRRSLLVKEVSLLEGIVEKRSTMPILNYLLLKAQGDSLEIQGTDLELGGIVKIEAQVEEGGAVTVESSKFLSLMKDMDGEFVEIVEEEDSKIEIRCGKSNYTLFGLSPDNYPTIPLPQNEEKIVVDIDIFKSLIKAVRFSISEDQYKDVNGADFIAEGNTLSMVSTDYSRLSYMKGNVEKNYGHVDFLIHKKALSELSKMGDGGDLEILKGVNNIFFINKNKILISRVIEGKFPDFGDYIHQSKEKKIVFKREEMLKALKRICNIITSRVKVVLFEIGKGNILLNYESAESGIGKENLECSFMEEIFRATFNAVYVKEFLETLSCEEVAMELNDEKSSVRFSPVGGIPLKERVFDSFYIIMPYE